MESLIRHLVTYGVEFRTLVKTVNERAYRVMNVSPDLIGFTGMPRIPDIKEKRTAQDYSDYYKKYVYLKSRSHNFYCNSII